MINRASLQIRMVFKLLTQVQEKQLRGFAADIRSETIKMISKIGVGHVGGCQVSFLYMRPRGKRIWASWSCVRWYIM